MSILLRYLVCFYLFVSAVLGAKSSQYFYSGVGITANLGPGATLVNSKDGLMTGNIQTNGSAQPRPPVPPVATFEGNIYAPNPPGPGFQGGTLSGTITYVSPLVDPGAPTAFSGSGTLTGTVNALLFSGGIMLNGIYQNDFSNLRTLFLDTPTPIALSNTTNLVIQTIGGTDVNTGGVRSSNITQESAIISTTTNPVNVEITPVQRTSNNLQDAGSAPSPANRIINFSQASEVKNKTGLSYLLGITSQYVFEKGLMLGFSVNYGRTGASSTVDYAAGTLVNNKFQQSDTVSFFMKDKGYISELVQVGYAWRRFNPYVIFGLAQHRAQLNCPGAYQNNTKGLSKGYNAPVFGLGLNVAINKNFYFNVQWQRHFGRTKQWESVGGIVPGGRIAGGAPQTRLGASMILVGVTYITPFGSK